MGPMAIHALVQLGHRSVLAATAPAAYKHLSEPHEFHLVLLDLQLGEQRSEPLILRLRDEGFEIPKILIFSAQPLAELQHAASEIGARDILQKPASIENLHQAIERAAA